MKTNLNQSRRSRAGFTLVELLTVIAIIAILAAMLLPVLAAAKTHALKVKAKLQESDIVTAIEKYDSDYGRFPVSAAAQTDATKDTSAANPNGSDYTYGGNFYEPDGTPWVPADTANYTTTNSDVIAILMDLTNYPGGGMTVNTNYQKNPRQIAYLNPSMSGDTNSAGVGTDLVYRDPWGNPYVISMDLNYDDQCQDAFYCLSAVSGPGGANTNPGLNGLVNPDTSKNNNFRYHGKVMVWSAGPPVSGKPVVDPGHAANVGANKNHVVSWQ